MTGIRASLQADLGACAEARRSFEHAVTLAGEAEDNGALTLAHTFGARACLTMGDSAEALAHSRRGVELAERLGTRNVVGMAYAHFGAALLLYDRLEEAAEALETASARGLGSQSNFWDSHYARTQLRLGDRGRARTTAEDAVRASQKRGMVIQESDAQLALAEILLATEGARARDAVETALARVSEIIDETELRSREPRIHERRAALVRKELDVAKEDEKNFKEIDSGNEVVFDLENYYDKEIFQVTLDYVALLNQVSVAVQH